MLLIRIELISSLGTISDCRRRTCEWSDKIDSERVYFWDIARRGEMLFRVWRSKEGKYPTEGRASSLTRIQGYETLPFGGYLWFARRRPRDLLRCETREYESSRMTLNIARFFLSASSSRGSKDHNHVITSSRLLFESSLFFRHFVNYLSESIRMQIRVRPSRTTGSKTEDTIIFGHYCGTYYYVA